WEVRCEPIDKARVLRKPKRFVPQVSVEQSRHRFINAGDLKDEDVSSVFFSSPENRDQHLVFASRRGLNHRRASLADLHPKISKRPPVARFESILKSCQTRT